MGVYDYFFLTVLAVWLVVKEYSVSSVSKLIAGDASFSMVVDVIKYLTYAAVAMPMLLVYWLSRKARSKIQAVYSQFWYTLFR